MSEGNRKNQEPPGLLTVKDISDEYGKTIYETYIAGGQTRAELAASCNMSLPTLKKYHFADLIAVVVDHSVMIVPVFSVTN